MVLLTNSQAKGKWNDRSYGSLPRKSLTEDESRRAWSHVRINGWITSGDVSGLVLQLRRHLRAGHGLSSDFTLRLRARGHQSSAMRFEVGPMVPFFANPHFGCQSCRDGGVCRCIAADFGPQRMGRIPLPSQRLLSHPGICMAANGEYANTSLWHGTRRRDFMLVRAQTSSRAASGPASTVG